MKRRILLLMMTALLSVGAWAADDLTLNVSDAKGFTDWGGFTPVSGTAFTVQNWATGGWEFETALSEGDYCGVEFAFEATSVKRVTFTITFEGGKTQEIDVPSGSTGFSADFAYSGGIKKLVFSYGDHDVGVPDNVTFTFTKAVVKAESTGEVTELSFSNLTTGDNTTRDDENNSFTMPCYKWETYWAFSPAISSDDYEKVVITFSEAIPNKPNLAIRAHENSGSDEWNGTQIGTLTGGTNKATAYFSSKLGVNIDQLGFYFDWNEGATASTLNIASAKLYKKPTKSITIGSMTNGTVTASVTEAWEGKTVILTPVPDGNYEISGAPTVTDGNSASVTVTDNGDGTYSFTMPATAVTVSATFTHDDDLTLSTDKILCFNSTGGRVTDQRYYTNSHTLYVGDGEHNGWDLTIGRIAMTEEFSGVTISFTDKQNIQLEIAYNDGSDKTYTKDLSSETSPVSINFSTAGITGVLKSIKFARKVSGDSKIVFNNETSVTMQIASEATYPTPRTSLKLTYETLMDSGNGSVTYDTGNKTFTIAGGDNARWAFWDFILPIPTTLYNGIYFKLTQAPANSKIEIIYDGNGDNPQVVEIKDAVTSETKTTYNVNFDRPGNVTRIRFAGAGTYEMGTCTAKPAKYQVTVSAAQYATFGDLGSPDVIDYSLATSSGLEAFIVTDYDPTTGKVKLTKVSKATANTAVVLYANINTSTSYTVQTAKAAGTSETSDDVDGNKLHISDGTVTGDGSTIYVLANKDQVVGFYQLANNVTIPADKAYLEISDNTLRAPAFIGFGDDTTGISEELRVKSEEFATAQYYDLQGRRVAQPSQGLYIVNGKKVVIK